MPPEIRQLCKELKVCQNCCRRVANQLAAAEAGPEIREVRVQVWKAYGGEQRGLMKLKYRRCFEEGDMDGIPGFDEVTAEVQLAHPWVRDAQHLFEILREPVRDLRPEKSHWEQAVRLLTPSEVTADSGTWF